MSRQKGHRRRPASEQLASRYAARERRTRRTEAERRPRSPWTAVIVGTFVSIFLYGLVVTAILEAGDGDNAVAAWTAAGAAALVPVLMAIIALTTRTARAWWVIGWTPLAVAVGLMGGALVTRDITTGYVLGVGLGAAFAFRLDDRHRREWRLWTVAGVALLTRLLALVAPAVAIVAAPLLPLACIVLVDGVVERRFEAEADH